MRRRLGKSRFVVVGIGVIAALAIAGGVLFVGGQADQQPCRSPDIGFEPVTNESGLEYADDRSTGGINGNAGVYAADYDDDGWMDLLTVGSGTPVLWRNEEGTFERARTFELSEGTEVISATFVDVEEDGREDLILFPKNDSPRAFDNTGAGYESTDLGLEHVTYPLGGAAADYDGDGDSDLLVYQSGQWETGVPAGFYDSDASRSGDNGNPNYLYENVGGEFERVNWTGRTTTRWTLAASFVDLNGDGLPDVHAANDFGPDTVYLNEGNGTFTHRPLGDNTSRNAMSSEIADYVGNGHPDIYVTNIELPITEEAVGEARYEELLKLYSWVINSPRTEGNNLLVNRGNATFDDLASAYDVRVGGWGWAASAVDFDHDGRRDLIHATQDVIKIDQQNPVFTYPMLFERVGSGYERLNASEIGLRQDNGRGLVAIDYDRDGDMELVSANYVGRFTVYENTVNCTRRNAIEFVAVDETGGPALGATVKLELENGTRTIFQQSRTDYLSQEPRRTHAGLDTQEAVTFRVTWPDGTRRTFEGVSAGQFVQLHKNGTVVSTGEFRSGT